MILKIERLDKFILSLLSYVVLIDMINGYFMMEVSKFPISQFFKFFILILLLLRLSNTKSFGFLLILFLSFQIGGVFALIKTGDYIEFLNDVIVATKWFNVPLSFFYFKHLFNRQQTHSTIIPNAHKFIRYSLIFLSINMILGILGYGMAFYNHGYSNAIGTKGFIYAGNELTILLLAIGFSIALWCYVNKQFKSYFLFFGLIMFFAFLMTSKTALGGILIVFLIPPISQIKFKIRKKWIDYLILILGLGLPMLSYIFYVGIHKMGVIDKIKLSMERSNNEILTVLLSNRNNFIKNGWEVFINDYSWPEKFFGLGQNYHLKLSGHLAEIDFFSLLFASGIIGLICLLLLIFYWLYLAYKLSLRGNHFAKAVFVFIIFVTIVSNLSGHIYGSGIAGYFIGFCLALMFLKNDLIKSNE